MDLETVRSKLRWPELAVTSRPSRGSLQRFSPFSDLPAPTLAELDRLALQTRLHDRAMGSLVGLAVADALGHPLEFIDVASESGQGIASFSLAQKLAAAAASEEEELPPAAGGGDMLLPPPRRTRPTLRGYVNPMNQFALEPGQWTDDTSMALCMADSLIRCGRFDGSDMRLTFWS